MKTSQEILERLIDIYGTDTGTVFGISNTGILKVIIEFTLEQIEECAECGMKLDEFDHCTQCGHNKRR